eukprot:CAMPEP_0183293000 /NCGR_PEP_ID=MMETSP0160_2-20130417/1863_1 /TAXON_ID=2839 ORGANISM="Odontella Sinensis, Strain Grunow 1884" /NCGR_SAMPLE_ID=MMETSP0160_2 /ASSEMBLY_ACC=CAM_ASM_000250 /LENGTH=57 /DNA_ID=CAMNT_0025454053 /DNA_START=544 /DNA_END=713 /DNA_ORIENTATION=-
MSKHPASAGTEWGPREWQRAAAQRGARRKFDTVSSAWREHFSAPWGVRRGTRHAITP